MANSNCLSSIVPLSSVILNLPSLDFSKMRRRSCTGRGGSLVSICTWESSLGSRLTFGVAGLGVLVIANAWLPTPIAIVGIVVSAAVAAASAAAVAVMVDDAEVVTALGSLPITE